jgi:two-component system nitrogen regulation response regulator NtrX
MFIMHAGGTVTAAKLPPEFRNTAPAPQQTAREIVEEATESRDTRQFDALIADGPSDLKQARADFEARFLETKLKECDGNITQLARAVGLERSSLYRKLKAYRIQTD